MKFHEARINMKKSILLALTLYALNGYAQTDSVIYYSDSLVYRIDTTIIAGDDTIATDSNFVQHNYHYIASDSTYEDQFVIIDSLGKVLVPIQALIDKGYSSSGTVKRLKLNVTQIGWTPEQLRDSLILPDLKSIYGTSNVTKL